MAMYLISMCWLLICLMNVSFVENPIVFMVLAGLLIALTLAGGALLIESSRQRRLGAF